MPIIPPIIPAKIPITNLNNVEETTKFLKNIKFTIMITIIKNMPVRAPCNHPLLPTILEAHIPPKHIPITTIHHAIEGISVLGRPKYCTIIELITYNIIVRINPLISPFDTALKEKYSLLFWLAF